MPRGARSSSRRISPGWVRKRDIIITVIRRELASQPKELSRGHSSTKRNDMVDINSELFSRLVRSKSLPHPTARNFEFRAWEDAFASIGVPTRRDRQMLDAAKFFGREIQLLRNTFEPRLLEGMDRRTGVLLSIAMANYNFLILAKLAHEAARKHLRNEDGRMSCTRFG
jgi:hypothetical protein